MEKEHKIFALTITFFLTITVDYGQYCSETVMRAVQLTGEKSSAVMIARPTITQASSFHFGRLFAIDDPLILEPEPTLALIRNTQGLYVSSNRDPVVFTLVMYADFTFKSGRFNRSSFSLFSRNLFLDKVRELAIVGGRDVFRMARGFALTLLSH
ncbi:hypothetical protein ERO13_D01G156832v2 [Gossypium hirsutum]|nr:hypothetical protein ERO13_D01G156832v2 [Gossypium hirsutum]